MGNGDDSWRATETVQHRSVVEKLRFGRLCHGVLPWLLLALHSGWDADMNSQQIAKVHQASMLLDEALRARFCRMVQSRLDDVATPSNSEVNRALYFVLNHHGIALGSNRRRELSGAPPP